MGVNVIQLTSKSHHENILASLHQFRLLGQLSDVTVQVEDQGEVQEFQVHQVMLAASSGYFRKILLSQDERQDKLVLSDMHFNDFSRFLEFVYTGKVEVARDKIGDVQAMAHFLDCEDLAQVCGEAMSAGILHNPSKKTCAAEAVAKSDLHDAKKEKGTKGKRPTRSACLKRRLSPQRNEKQVVSKKSKTKKTQKDDKRPKRKRLRAKKEDFYNENQVCDENTEENECEHGSGTEEAPEKDFEASLEMAASDVDEWEYPEDPSVLFPREGEEEDEEEDDEEEDGRQSKKSFRTSKAQFQCNKCQRTFHYERSYLKHISTYHGVKVDVVYRCETCQQTFANRSNLKVHEKHVHSAERLFSCESCAKTFKRKKDVVRHQRQVHERSSLRHVCTECGKSLSSKTALLLHERTHTGVKPFECTDCGAKFTQNSALKMHRRTHTGEKPFACDECDSRFTQKHMLDYHKRSHTGEKPFMCEACGKSFASKEYLGHHSNIHTGSRPYKCDQCGRGFAQRNSLHQHLKIHTGERPYSCKDCDKHFTQLNALQRHQRIHTGEKPYMCGLCRRTFTDKSTLRRHTMIHDSDAPWKTYLVVLEGNVEDRKPKLPVKGKAEKAGAGEKKSITKKSDGAVALAAGPAAAGDATGDAASAAGDASGDVSAAGDAGGDASAAGDAAGDASAGGDASAAGDTSAAADTLAKTQTVSVVVPAEPVTLPPEWTTHGAIALVSHSTVGGITVIHTEVPPGTQIQPILTTDSKGASAISLEGSAIPVPFSVPVSVTHAIPASSQPSTVSLPIPTLSVPVSDGTLATASEIPAVSTSSVLEATASETIVAPDSGSKAASGDENVQSDIQMVIVGEEAQQKDAT